MNSNMISSARQFTKSTDYINMGPMRVTHDASAMRKLDAQTPSMGPYSAHTPYSRPINSIKPNMPAQQFFAPTSNLFVNDSENRGSENIFGRPLTHPVPRRTITETLRTDVPASSNPKFDISHKNDTVTIGMSTKKQKLKMIKPPPKDFKRILFGSVDHVIRWYRIAKSADLYFLYEAIGTLDNWSLNGNAHLLFVRGELGQVLQGLFYSVDRELQLFRKGTTISMVGKMVGSHKMMVIDAEEIRPEEKPAIQRLSFLCQRMLNSTAESDNTPLIHI